MIQRRSLYNAKSKANIKKYNKGKNIYTDNLQVVSLI